MSREKQIEEIARTLCENGCKECTQTLCADWYKAEALYNAGYRKQVGNANFATTTGEWIEQEKIRGKVSPEAVCSNCGREVVYQVIDGKWAFENFCPHCGAKMKGGAE